VPEDVHGAQEREVLHIRQLLGHGRQVDRKWKRGQPDLYLEPSDQGNRPDATGPLRCGFVQRGSPD